MWWGRQKRETRNKSATRALRYNAQSFDPALLMKQGEQVALGPRCAISALPW
jgi:hypothetical protein